MLNQKKTPFTFRESTSYKDMFCVIFGKDTNSEVVISDNNSECEAKDKCDRHNYTETWRVV